MSKIKLLDLYCGAGGFAQGFKELGFEVTGVDFSEWAGKTFVLNKYGTFKRADLKTDIIQGDFDIIIGGPPCKPWSAVNLTKRGKNHPDFVLLSRYFKHIEVNMPSVFMLENVPLITGEPTLAEHIRKMQALGYSVEGKIIRYSDYGAPTRRRRFILHGSRINKNQTFFLKLSQLIQEGKTVKEVIWDLRDKNKNAVCDHDWPELKTIWKYADKYKSNRFGWYILDWNKPAPSFGNVMKTYILHPDAFLNGNARVVSVKEVSLILGYDRDFLFPEGAGLGVRYQMIVDSVSPIFSKVVASIVKEEIC